MIISDCLYVFRFSSFFFFNDPAPTEIYTLSLHDALPISAGDLGGLVAHTFKVMRDFHRSRDEPEIAGQRRFGEEPDRDFVDFDFELVEFVILVLDRPGEVIVAGYERFDGLVDRVRGLAGHGEKLFL